jgi:hypothetical protein
VILSLIDYQFDSVKIKNDTVKLFFDTVKLFFDTVKLFFDTVKLFFDSVKFIFDTVKYSLCLAMNLFIRRVIAPMSGCEFVYKSSHSPSLWLKQQTTLARKRSAVS